MHRSRSLRPAVSRRFVCLSLLVAGALTGCRSTAAAPPFVVASDLANPPFAWVDAEGQAQGRDVAMMQVLTGLIDHDLVWARMDFDELLDAVASGEVDAVCATMGVTAERAQRVRFTRPYFRTELLAVVLNVADAPANVADLGQLRVAAGAGTTSEFAVRERLPDCVPSFGLKGDGERLRMLRAGELDALVMDGPNARQMVADSGGELRLVSEALATEEYALALPLRSEQGDALDELIGYLERSGVMEALDAEYGLSGR